MSAATTKLYKVLGPEGQAYHGGSGSWPLPSEVEPGEWVRVEGPLVLCENGLHLTDAPRHWWKTGARVFEVEVEADAEVVGSLADGDHKIAVRAARLHKEADWGEFCVWFDGEHSLSEGEAYAYGSASVTASGSASVRAYGSASVYAYGSASVYAYGSASVTASGSASVISTIYHSSSAEVALADMAAHIDRRSGRLELRRAT